MTSMHIRHRRLLSADRRLGSQLERDVLAGRVQRHAQGWRDCGGAGDELDAARGIVWAAAVGALSWAAMLAVLLFITQ